MTALNNTERRVNKYLHELAAALRGLPVEQVRDIVAELRSHIVEKVAGAGNMTAATVEAVLIDLGNPEDLASQYLTEDLQVRAVVSRSPLLILRSQLRWASINFAGCFVLLASLLGYFFAAALFCCALFKPIHPRTAGLWMIPDTSDPNSFSLRLGFAAVPPGSRDVLGWWIVPIGLVVGFGLFFLTPRFGLWNIRRLRRAAPANTYGIRRET